MRGYFSIGSERISKPMNLGALMRTANAFGASYVFSIEAGHRLRDAYQADTSKSAGQIPYYQWDSIDAMQMPRGCQLVGINVSLAGALVMYDRHLSMGGYAPRPIMPGGLGGDGKPAGHGRD